MKKDFITATPDSGTGGKTVTTTAAANTAFQDKQTTLNVSGGGITRSVKATESGVPFLFDLGISVTAAGASSLVMIAHGQNETTFDIQSGCPIINSFMKVMKGGASGFSIRINPILLIKSSIKSSPYLMINSGSKVNFNQMSEKNDYTLYQPTQEASLNLSNPTEIIVEVYNGSTKILKYDINVSYI